MGGRNAGVVQGGYSGGNKTQLTAAFLESLNQNAEFRVKE